MQGVTFREIPAGKPGAGIPVVRLHYSADPTMTPERLQALRSKYTSEARYNREMEIQYEALEGELLYPEFRRERNLCDPFDVSDRDRWTLYMALDPHPRTAHAMAWEAVNKHGDRVVCGEFWPEFGTPFGATDGIRWHTREYAEWIQFFESDSEDKPEPFLWARGKRLFVHRRFMDTFGSAANSDEGEDYFETYRRLGFELTKKEVARASWSVNLHFDPALKGHDNLAKAQDSIARHLMPQQNANGENMGPPQMRIFSTLHELIDEMENVRFKEGEAEKISDERVVTYQKHCIGEGVPVLTSRGKIPIESVRPGDFVATRGGWHRVMDAWFVGVRPVLRMGDLVATGDHLVFVNGCEWKELQFVSQCDTLMSCESLTKAKFTTITRESHTSSGLASYYTAKFGKRLLETFQKIATFTTKTEIQRTMTLATSNAYRPRLTWPNTIGVTPNGMSGSAYFAGSDITFALLEDMRSFVADAANRARVEGLKSMTRLASAVSVNHRSESGNPGTLQPVLGHVRASSSLKDCGSARVYDLSVEGEHEFFAGGVLVHNCLDCLHYIETSRPIFHMRQRAAPPSPYDPNIVR